MRTRYLLFAAALSLGACQNGDKPMNKDYEFQQFEVAYPEVRQDDVKDDYHGTEVSDPYRWLEDDNSEETKAWVVEQNKATFGYLEKIPFRKSIENRLEKLWNYEKYGSPFKEGGKYYYFKNDGLQNQYVMYVADSPTDPGKVILDPNKFSEDGTASLGGYDFSKDGKYLAYLVSEGGSDWRSAKVMDLSTGKDIEDNLEWIKFSGVSWKGDGFYYSRYPEPKDGDELSAKNEYHALYYHKLGDDQSEDQLIYVDKENPQRNVYAGVTEDENFLIINTSESTSGNGLHFVDLRKGDNKINTIVSTFEHDYSYVDNDGDDLLIITNDGSPKQKLISIDTKNPAKNNWKDIIPESEDPLRSISIIGGKIFANYMHNASTQVKVYDLKGKFIQDLELPGIGTSGGIVGKKSDTQGFYSFTSFTRPSTIYSLNSENLTSEIFRQPEVDFDSDNYVTTQKWFKSKDGTEVPMFITHKKGIKMDGSAPTLLYGYGGFNIPLTPGFSISKLPLLETGGIYVMANLRGGGEFGSEWHKSGTLGKKQNVFDDFISAAEYLIDNKYTSSDKLAIQGGSNGGLLVGACMTQRPDLFAVAFPAVGVLDMLRYHQFTIGWAWATDYGKSDDPEAFDYLIKYSPLHNVKKAAYPATMITTADHDDRVVPAHSFKFASELQNKHTGEAPVLIRVETSAGHGAGKPTSKQIEEAADILSFMLWNTKTEYEEQIAKD